MVCCAVFCALALRALAQSNGPAVWGKNHVGQPVPEFVHGDECLFCHRADIGNMWPKTAHGSTVREKEDAPELLRILDGQPALGATAPQIEFFLGSRRHIRFLRKEGYGKFALLSTQAVLGPDHKVQSWTGLENPQWDRNKFADRCAGCHTTAVDPATKAFSAFGLDCYTCHGAVTLDHTKDTTLIWLSKKRRNDTQAVTSICAQCHLRMAKSRSNGLPYPNNFIAGDNLFQDYEVDFSQVESTGLNAGDRHVLRNVRDVVLHRSTVTCLDCHRVHTASSARHRFVLNGPICLDCHNAQGPKKVTKSYTVHSALCEY